MFREERVKRGVYLEECKAIGKEVSEVGGGGGGEVLISFLPQSFSLSLSLSHPLSHPPSLPLYSFHHLPLPPSLWLWVVHW